MQVIFENDDFLVINKENNLSVQDNDHYDDSIEKRLRILYPFSSLPRCGIVHRLDHNTTGLLLIAKNLVSLNGLKLMFKERNIRKTYVSLNQGKSSSSSGQITLFLRKNFSKGKQVKMKISSNDGKLVNISFRILDYNANFNCSLVESIPVTGRTHQIRVAFQAIKIPIYNDSLYGNSTQDNAEHSVGQYLHAYSLSFKFKKKEFYFSADLPDFFFEKLRILGFDFSQFQRNVNINEVNN